MKFVARYQLYDEYSEKMGFETFFLLASPFVGEEHQDNILIDCCCMSYHISSIVHF